MTWSISIPHRSRRDSLVDVAALVRHVPGQDEDRNALRQLVIQAQVDGVASSAGELIDHIGALEPAERRAMLDNARRECGLPSTAEAEERQRFEAANAIAQRHALEALQTCHAPNCRTMPTYDDGSLRPVRERRWFCPEHAHLATELDTQPRLVLRRQPSGGFCVVDPVEEARQAAIERSLHQQTETRLIEARGEAEAARRSEQARREQARRELPAGMRGLIP